MPVKPLAFKGDKKPRPKKRKHRDENDDPHHKDDNDGNRNNSNVNGDDNDDEETTWVTPDAPIDLSGPTMLVLPTSPPTALASDAHGNIFASPLENIIDSNPLTAEPHDVRQVWVASRVAGMGEGHVSFKAAHGGYLSCDGIGVLGARREARGVEEGFVAELIVDTGGDEKRSRGSWRLRTSLNVSAMSGKVKEGEERYLAAVVDDGNDDKDKSSNDNDDDEEDVRSDSKPKPKRISVSLRGDGEKGGESTRLVVKMQAKFKPKVQRDKEQRKSEKVSRAELERVVGRRLEEDEVRRLKKAKKNGTYYEEILDVRVKGKHDKFA